jgi:hypothetical protein
VLNAEQLRLPHYYAKRKNSMTNKQASYMNDLRVLKASSELLDALALECDLAAEREWGEARLDALATMQAHLQTADATRDALREMSSAWPWPMFRERAVPGDEVYYSSYDCPQCTAEDFDSSTPPPPTCRRCGAPVGQRWDY